MKAETHFSAEQRRLAYPSGYEAHYWHDAKRRIVDRLLDGIGAGPILDLGCGDGAYVRHLRAIGREAFGMDRPLAGRAEFLFEGELADLPRATAARVRTLLLSDVLEHLDPERDLLRDCRRRLPALEHIVLTVPARQELWSNYDRYYGHFRRYSLDALRAVLSGEGLRVARCGYFFHLLYLPAWLFARLGRSLALAVPANAARPLHRALGWLLAAESRWLPDAWLGTSAYAVCAVPGR
jgi:SAM-dependent methyltransferase